ncbi:alkaline phosphatase PhoX [Rhodohalobacter barkolensis]|uniref:Phosphatase n=1 Tax=Rhodohalobacter barkolensis TaxID=2053187 RepID=A0A2N0VEB0_9BACT|nr:alkaline phosphatase PhoX [Rhodohalobacter barkolensis]PKD42458.1 phosphatase [Rhodohalobacter barkolensis]
MSISRRNFLKQAGAVSVGFSGLHLLMGAGFGFSSAFNSPAAEGYGPLQEDPDGIFDLPDGFSYKIVSRFGEIMDDGFRLPHVPDGMAAFPGKNGLTVVVRNHEVNADAPDHDGPFIPGKSSGFDHSKVYDWGGGKPALGGTTNLIYDTKNQKVVRQFLSLAGTIRNCAGGPTPWNTWITCEETVQKADGHFEKDHGFVFEVPASTNPELYHAQPIKEMGRFNHEAVAVDPNSGVVYLTEDRSDGLLYRFIPNKKGELLEGGELQALIVKDQRSLDTRNWEAARTVELNTSLEVEWITMENVLAPDDDLRHRGFEKGAAKFARGEGMWYGNGTVFFACTNGGRAKKGQIWKYTPSPYEATGEESGAPGKLELFVEPNDATVIENADNLTVSPWGDLIVCEDGDGDQYLVGVTPEGSLYKFGRNALNESELAGATFSPDGSTLFFNIQKAGLTLAVTGPWKTHKA